MRQEIHGHLGRKDDPLYAIRMILRCGQEKLTDRQRARLDRAIAGDERHDEVLVASLGGIAGRVQGEEPAAERGCELVCAERCEPNLVALAAALLALLLLLPNRRDGLIAVFAAAVATGMTLAVMTLAVGALNPLTLALGALTAAVGAEFTVLLLAAKPRPGPGTPARSVWLAALPSLGGYGVLASSHPILRELGLALAASVALSVSTALLLTAIGSGPAAPDLPHREPAVMSADSDLQLTHEVHHDQPAR